MEEFIQNENNTILKSQPPLIVALFVEYAKQWQVNTTVFPQNLRNTLFSIFQLISSNNQIFLYSFLKTRFL